MKFLKTISIFFFAGGALFSCKEKEKKQTQFESLPASFTKIEFSNEPAKHDGLNILSYPYYYNGGGVATGDINNDGLPDIYFTANKKSGNKLYLNKGNFVFEDITEKAGVAGSADWCTGVTMTDINGDGLLDIYTSAVSGQYDLKGHNELFINNGDNIFTESAAQYGLALSALVTQTAFFDYDRDGDLDCYILCQSPGAGSNVADTAFRHRYDSLSGDRLYRNDINTTGKFTDVSAEAGIYQSSLASGLGLAISDLNNDGWDDIYVGNDFYENDYYYINNGNGTFTESGSGHFKRYSHFSTGNDIADYNNDGQMDLVTADMIPENEKTVKSSHTENGYQKQYPGNLLQCNNGNGNSFSDTVLQNTACNWAPLFADFDNDGRKDLFVTSGIVKRPVDSDNARINVKNEAGQTEKSGNKIIKNMPDGSSHPFIYKGEKNMNFKNMSEEWGIANMKGYYTGASYSDLNNDGNLDIIINAVNSPAVILKNNAAPKLMVDIVFKGDSLNRFGIGAKAWVFQKGKMQYQQLHLTRGFQSSVEPIMHFGLDSLRYIDSLLVVWPNQKYQWLKNIPAVGRIDVRQSEAAGIFSYNNTFPQPVTLALKRKMTQNNPGKLTTAAIRQAGVIFADYSVHADNYKTLKNLNYE